MTAPIAPVPQGPASNGRVMQAILRFGAAELVIIVLLAVALARFVYPTAAGQHAVIVTAWLAFFVQLVTFAIAKLVARQNVMAGWGLGALLRFATLAMWGFIGVKALELEQMPALVSLAAFFFVSTLVEPLFLNN